jgi:hypothetical protein
MQYDWVRGSVMTGTFAGRFLMHVGAMTGQAGCAEFETIALSYYNPVEIIPNTAMGTFRRSNVDGDFDVDGYSEGRGAYLLSTTNPSAAHFEVDTAAGGLPPTSSFHIQGLVATDSPIVTRDSVTLADGADYLVQSDGADGTWLFLNCPLDNGMIFTVQMQ